MQSSLASLIVAVFKRNTVEYYKRIPSLYATQFTEKRKSLIASDSQRLIEIVFVVQVQTGTKFHSGKIILENFTGELDAAIIKYFEINLFFNISFLSSVLSYLLVRSFDFLRWFVDGK